jgi:hypothetical protein
MLPALSSISKQQALLTGGMLVGSELAGFIADAAMHSATHNGVFLGLVATGMVAYNSKKLSDMFLPKPASEISEKTERVINAVAPVTEVHPDQHPISKLKRLVGLPSDPPTWPKDTSEDEQLYEPEPEDEYEEPLPPPTRRGVFNFSSLLGSFTPTLDKIYLGMLPEGGHIFCKAEDLCHVALAGSTGGGKSSIMRLLMSQLCKAGAQVLLLNPHYTRYDLKSGEDWTPFEKYLHFDPMECRKYSVIEHYLKYTSEVLLPRRREKYAHSMPVGKPYFIVLDELPSIIKHVPDAPGYLSELLREGRKFGIYLITASQDFLVKTIDPSGGGGAVRDCYRTAYYVGGDATTAKIMLDMAPRDIPEHELGKGQVMLRCASSEVKKATRATVPYVDNDALYRLLGPSTYRPTQQMGDMSEEPLPQPGRAQQAQAPQPQYQPLPQTPRPQRMEPLAPNPLQRSRALPPPEIVEAVNAFHPGMGYREFGRALGYSDAEARALWRELNERYRHLLAAKGGQPANTTTVLAEEQQTNSPELSRELRIALNLYNAGHDSYRKLGDAMVIDKDRAGKLIRELQEMGLIKKSTI